SRILSVALRELERYLPLHICSVWLTEDIESAAAEEDAINKDGNLPSQATASLVLADTGALLIERALEFGLVKGRRVRLAETPFSACLASGEAQYTDLAHALEQTNPLMETLATNGANASFAVPLRAGDRTVGILHSVCLRPTGFTSEQIHFLYLVADLLGPAISNCQLFGRLKSAYEELRYTQNQLIQSEKMRALGELASGMAHDFNNSLCGVLGFLELALTDRHLSSTA